MQLGHEALNQDKSRKYIVDEGDESSIIYSNISGYKSKTQSKKYNFEQSKQVSDKKTLATKIWIGKLLLLLTTAFSIVLALTTISIMIEAYYEGQYSIFLQGILFLTIVGLLVSGSFVYQLTRHSCYKRQILHRAADSDTLEEIYLDQSAPTLTILIPSYKEELEVVRQTLLSASLQEHPDRRVVLLVDDPHAPLNIEDKIALNKTLALVEEIQLLINSAKNSFSLAYNRYMQRRPKINSLRFEGVKLEKLYLHAANWFEERARNFKIRNHTDELFCSITFKTAARDHVQRANYIKKLALEGRLTLHHIDREFSRLNSLFKVEVTSFQRKRYLNLSHEPNKAMNLNSYISLIGKSWKEETNSNGVKLIECSFEESTFDCPYSEFIITLDADSLLAPKYALTLLEVMRRKGNERMAVAQTPYTAIPGAQSSVERLAGATTDAQYIVHQGFTAYDSTFWVGANAMLRTAALYDIKEDREERGYTVSQFIHDRTVIEDTESSIDLISKGWSLYNYPEKLSYSATPSDFGSLTIQRSRWANGGLIIFPKFLRKLRKVGVVKLWKQALMRTNYLTSIATSTIAVILLFIIPFNSQFESVWLPLAALPYFLAYGLDLVGNGYRFTDLFRVYALNLLLIPVNLAGVLKSIEQGIKGKKIPFRRTPKVHGRTSVSAVYIGVIYSILSLLLFFFLYDLYSARYWHASLTFLNSIFFLYGLVNFIGFKESFQDLGIIAETGKKAESAILSRYLEEGIERVGALSSVPSLQKASNITTPINNYIQKSF